MFDPTLIFAVSLIVAAPVTTAPAGDDAPTDRPVIACSLSSPELRERIARIREDLLPAVEQVVDLPNGYELVVPNEPGRIQKLAEMVELESRCCAFLDFEIRLAAGSPSLSLVMTGPEGTREVLEELAVRARQRPRR